MNKQFDCQFAPPYPTPLFVNNQFYCINNDYNIDNPSKNEYVLSIDVATNKINWQSHLYSNTSLETNLIGLYYTSNNYIAVFDAAQANLFILDSDKGSILYTLNICQSCSIENGIGIVGMNGIFYIFWVGVSRDTNVLGGLIAVNASTQQVIKSLNNMNDNSLTNLDSSSFPQTPTICGDNDEILIINDLFTTFNAYNITLLLDDSNNNGLLWNRKAERGGSVLVEPPVCINYQSPNASQVFANVVGSGNEFVLLDAASGKEIRNFTYDQPILGLPAINIDEYMIVFGDIDYVYGYDINWNIIWKIENLDWTDVIIVDTIVFLTSDGKDITAIDINNGSTIWTHNFQAVNYENGLRVVPGLDVNNIPTLIAVYEDDIELKKNYVYCFQ